MSRIKELQKKAYQVLEKSITDNDKQAKAVAHLHGVALAAAILAKKRGENAELSTMAGMLHDLNISGNEPEEEIRKAVRDFVDHYGPKGRAMMSFMGAPREREIVTDELYCYSFEFYNKLYGRT